MKKCLVRNRWTSYVLDPQHLVNNGVLKSVSVLSVKCNKPYLYTYHHLCGFAPVDSNILLGGKVGVFETPS